MSDQGNNRIIAKLQRKLVQAQIELSKIRCHTIFQLLEERRQLRIQLVHSRTEKQLQYQALLKEHEEILGEVRAECHRKCRMLEHELHQRKEAESKLNSEVRRLKEKLMISQNNTCNNDVRDVEKKMAFDADERNGDAIGDDSFFDSDEEDDDHEELSFVHIRRILSTLRRQEEQQHENFKGENAS